MNSLIILLLLASVVFAGCVQQTSNQTAAPQEEAQNAASASPETAAQENEVEQILSLSSPAFEHNGRIPVKHSCDGGDVIPPLNFVGVPPNAESLALIMDDPDAVQVVGFTYVHWVVFNIPPTTTTIAEGVQVGTVGASGSGENKYEGPCPPPGETHTYSFRLYALDTEIDLQQGASKQEVATAMQGHVLAQTELKGKYGQ